MKKSPDFILSCMSKTHEMWMALKYMFDLLPSNQLFLTLTPTYWDLNLEDHVPHAQRNLLQAATGFHSNPLPFTASAPPLSPPFPVIA